MPHEVKSARVCLFDRCLLDRVRGAAAFLKKTARRAGAKFARRDRRITPSQTVWKFEAPIPIASDYAPAFANCVEIRRV